MNCKLTSDWECQLPSRFITFPAVIYPHHVKAYGERDTCIFFHALLMMAIKFWYLFPNLTRFFNYLILNDDMLNLFWPDCIYNNSPNILFNLRSRSHPNVARQGICPAPCSIPHLPFQQVVTARPVPGEFQHRRGDANPQEAYPRSICAQQLQAHLEPAVHFKGAWTGRQWADASASSLERSPSGTSICISSQPFHGDLPLEGNLRRPDRSWNG